MDVARPKHDAERNRIDARLSDARDALERYFQAFEKGAMPEQACGARIDELSRQITGLQARRDELAHDDTRPDPLTDADIRELQAKVSKTFHNGDPPSRKALLQALIDEIKVVTPGEIHPIFVLPTVRPPGGSVELGGLEPPTSWVRSRNSPREKYRIAGVRAVPEAGGRRRIVADGRRFHSSQARSAMSA
jgi:hypothetical protein